MRAKWSIWITAIVVGVGGHGSRSDALTVAQPGYVAEAYKLLPVSSAYNDIEADQSGNLYIGACGFGVLKVDPSKIVTTWSTAPVCDVAMGDSGPQFGAGRGNCHCVTAFGADGSYVPLHQDAFEWTYVATTGPSTLYANLAAGPGQGLYTIDVNDGHASTIVAGGPGPGGAGWYFGMAGGSDGKLYVLGYDGASNGLFRLDASAFTLVASWPHGGVSLSQGPDGTFLTSVQFDSPGGIVLGEIWSIDPLLGSSTLLARSDPVGQPGMDGVAYDAASKTIYALEGYRIWTIRKDPSPAAKDTWGGVKARYRR